MRFAGETKGEDTLEGERLALLHELYVRSMYVANSSKNNRTRQGVDAKIRPREEEARRLTSPPAHRRPSPASESWRKEVRGPRAEATEPARFM